MKKIILLVCAGLLAVSCSDDDENPQPVNPIEGTWAFTSLETADSSNIAELAVKQVVEKLAENGCAIMTFSFKADGKLSIYDISEAFDKSDILTGNVSCPASGAGETYTGTYSYKNDVVEMHFDKSGEDESVTAPVVISGNTMKIKVKDIMADLPQGVDPESKVVLTRQ